MKTIQQYEREFYQIKWQTPVVVQWQEGRSYFACRVCIANHGLKIDSPYQWKVRDDALLHIRDHILNDESESA